MSVSAETVYAIPAEVRKSGRQEEIAAFLAEVLGMEKIPSCKGLLNGLLSNM